MTVRVQDLAQRLDHVIAAGDLCTVVEGLTHDSRQARPGWMFVALPGMTVDGHDYIDAALAAGASAILAERPPREHHRIPWITVPDTRKAMGTAAALVFGEPTRHMTMIGVTGTTGKTTITYLLDSILRMHGGVPGVLGTICHRWGGKERTAGHTTPEAAELQRLLSEMRRDGVTHVMTEVSSHGLHLHRLDGCHFDVGVFTNLSQDHLDYHGSMDDYYEAKRLLFTDLLPGSDKPSVAAVINGDDPWGQRLAQETVEVPVLQYGYGDHNTVRAVDRRLDTDGMSVRIQTNRGVVPVTSGLTGSFNVMNILAAVGVAESLDIEHRAIVEGIANVHRVPGRLEQVPCPRGAVFVDYAHTPDALRNVLAAIRDLRPERIITVMGCGGDRDRGKRPLMGREAARAGDFVVVTSDNPRTEDPLAIIEHIREGVEAEGMTPLPSSHPDCMEPGHYRIVPDRREAIAWAVRGLRDGDILLVAGKGHETYQEILGKRYPFDDRVAVAEALRDLSDGAPQPRCASCAGDEQ